MKNLDELFATEEIPNASDIAEASLSLVYENNQELITKILKNIQSAAKEGLRSCTMHGVPEASYNAVKEIFIEKGYKVEFWTGTGGTDLVVKW